MINVAKPIIGEEEKQAVIEVLESGMLAQGPKVKELEVNFAEYCGTRHGIAMNSGTAALHASLYAAGVGKGDEVITVPFTFVATANPILMQNAKIVFTDIEKETFNIDVDHLESRITDNTKAILAVDLYGHPAEYTGLKELAEKYNLKIIEDSCQAVGAEFNGKRAGGLGDLGSFSFYATKNMMCGEGGIVTTDNEEYAELCRRFRHHGMSEQTRYQYFDLGYNYRMMDIQAAIAIVQLKKIETINEKRIRNAANLTRGLSPIQGIRTPVVRDNVRHVYHQYTIIFEDYKYTRDEMIGKLKEKGVGCAVFYPKPLHLHPHFASLGFNEGDFPVSEELSQKVISLPVHPSVSDEDIETIIEAFQSIDNE